MKLVILAGGFGSRLGEETVSIPKPMIKIGEYPIIWHIMKYYSNFGIKDFIICLGYKGYVIKEFFINYKSHVNDIKVNTSSGIIKFNSEKSEDWNIDLVETGLNTMTGGRIRKIKKYIGNEDFCLTYGDGVSDINIDKLIAFHKKNKKIATVSSVIPPGRFGSMTIKNNHVASFTEHHSGKEPASNGGFFVVKPEIFKYIRNDQTIFERYTMQKLVKAKELASYKHYGFWHPMDTIRDKTNLEKMWYKNAAPWKIWK